VLGIFLVILLTAVTNQPVGNAGSIEYRQFQKGMTYVAWWHDTYVTAESDQSIQFLAETDANWVAIIVTWYQDTYTDSSVKPDADRTPTDASLMHAIQMIHRLGMSIMLKPHVDLLESERWRGEIEPRNEKAWFDSYRAFITHYAELAEDNNVEMLSIGTELNSMTQRGYTAYWLEIIDAIRRVYDGELTYAANWWPNSAWQDLGFLKELNYLGIDAYFPLTEKKDPTIFELKKAWQPWVSQIEAWQKVSGKQVILTEVGYRDLDGANIRPWDWQIEGSQDQQEQADCYQAALETFWGKPWLHGIFWWAWTYEQLPLDYTPWGKPSEAILRAWYAKPFIPDGTQSDAVPSLVAIQRAEDAIRRAYREDRTRGLDAAKRTLAESIDAYRRSSFVESEALATAAKKTADDTVNQQKYEEANNLVNQALRTVNGLRNVTLQSGDSVNFKQQAEDELATATDALARNDLENAKLHANSSIQLAERALSAERNYSEAFQAREAAAVAQQQVQNRILTYALVAAIIALLVVLAAYAIRKRNRRLTRP